MKQKKATIRILDEVNAVILGLSDDDMAALYDRFAMFAKDYFFHPKFKLGQWDGKIRYFQRTGKTYVYLLEEIIPILYRRGYTCTIDDLRTAKFISPNKIKEDIFAHILHPDTAKPTILREHQLNAVNSLLDHGNGTVVAATSAGKAQPLDAKVLTTEGWRLMGDLQTGDMVITPDGKQVKIVGVFPQGRKPIYRIVFHDGSSTECCKEHLWSVAIPDLSRSKKLINRIMSLEEIQTWMQTHDGYVSIPLIKACDSTDVALPVDPYLLGVLIGTGRMSIKSINLTCGDEKILVKIRQQISEYDVSLKHKTNNDYTLTKTTPQSIFPPPKNKLLEKLRDMGLTGCYSYNKFIPDVYFTGSKQQRLRLLQGLFDINGTIDQHGNVSFTTTSKRLASQVQEILWSLGATCSISPWRPTSVHKGQRKGGRKAYTLLVEYADTASLFTLNHKQDCCRVRTHNQGSLRRRIAKIEYVGEKDAQCIAVDDVQHLYITDDYIVTHNTLMCAALCKVYETHGTKTLTIVPNQDLIAQTKATYAHYGLDVGEYWAKSKDINHQHVVSTWQALQNNNKLVPMFDMVIVDECHSIKGNVLSNILTSHAKKIPYRFGFTGTLPKDGADVLSVHVAIGPKRYEIGAASLIEKGVLANLFIDVIQLQEDLTKEYEHFRKEEGVTQTYIQFKDTYFPDFTAEKNFLRKKSKRIKWIAQYIEKLRDRQKGNVLCLVDNIVFARKLAAEIPNAICVNGKDVKSQKERKAVYDLFEDSDNLVVIATVHIAGVGLNINRIFNMVLIDLGKSFIRVIQAIGRGLRKAYDKDRVHITDICADLKYGKKHMKMRTNFYTEQQYPYKKHVVSYEKSMTDTLDDALDNNDNLFYN